MVRVTAFILSLIIIIAGSIFLIKRVPSSTVRISNTNITVTIADEPRERTMGLSGWKKLEDDHGMLFVFSNQQKRLFWMHGMNFPIDIIWINNNQVLGVTKNLLPPHDGLIPEALSPEPVSMVLEVPAHYTDQHNIATGTPFIML